MFRSHAPTYVLSVDAEASSLGGQIIAIGAVVASDRGVASRFYADLSPLEIASCEPSEFVRQEVLPSLDRAWTDIRLTFDDPRAMFRHFFCWWRLWSSGSKFDFNQVVALHYGSSISEDHPEMKALSAGKEVRAGIAERDIITVVDSGFPVESRLFRECLELDPRFEYLGPNPLHEIATLRLLDNLSSTTALLREPRRKFVEHHPVDDAESSALDALLLLRRGRSRQGQGA